MFFDGSKRSREPELKFHNKVEVIETGERVFCSFIDTALGHSAAPYDTDSITIGVNNHASFCLTNTKDDFVNKPIYSGFLTWISGNPFFSFFA